MDKLALFGGKKTVNRNFSRYNTIGPEEVASVTKVLESGNLSQFLGEWHDDFFGGPKVREFERALASYFSVEHAVTMNSATSGLIAAVGASGIEPGDEVIVSPWTMSASATAILVWNAIPVFADIESETFNLDPASVESLICSRTKAIVVPHIFGHPAEMMLLTELARQHNLQIIEDSAQAPSALYRGRFTGTIGDIGVLSFNYHKHIHTGEGGACLTNDPLIAERLQLIRNHGEAVAARKGVDNLSNIIGFNFRMGEMEAAIGLEQLKKLPKLVEGRIEVAELLAEKLKGLDGLSVPTVKPLCTHVYYCFGMIFDPNLTGVSRDKVLAALRAEGIPIAGGYVNLHTYPMYEKRVAYGLGGYPWKSGNYNSEVKYGRGICPVAEKLNDEKYLGLGLCQYDYSKEDIELLSEGFAKVWSTLNKLKDWEPGEKIK